jgi:hypothetical protein
MPNKGSSSTKNNSVSPKKLPGLFQNKRIVLLVLVMVSVASVGGALMLRQSSARPGLGQPCAAGSWGCSPTIEQCKNLAIPYNRTIYPSVNPTVRNSCVAAVQAYLAWRWGEWLVTDGLFGYKTREAVYRFEKKDTFMSPGSSSADGAIGKSTWIKISLDCARNPSSYDRICRTNYQYR